MAIIKITSSVNDDVKEYEVSDEQANRIVNILKDLVLKKKAKHKELVSIAVSKHCKDKVRTVNEPCSFPIGSCFLCQNCY